MTLLGVSMGTITRFLAHLIPIKKAHKWAEFNQMSIYRGLARSKQKERNEVVKAVSGGSKART